MQRLTVAVDPGSSGGIAWQKTGGKAVASPLPKDEGERVGLISQVVYEHGDRCRVVCHMEKVTGFIPDRVEGRDFRLENSGHRMFNYGIGYGFLLGAFQMANVEPNQVTARVWQKHHGQKKAEGLPRAAWKRQLRDYCQTLFPDMRVTLKTADALLILSYAKTL